ncbi:MAG: hypothetical protein HYY41_00790, partial [Chloroflexi bacterium]|nr:hypothetical protein [Chloroflexota bacterium]
MKICYLNKGISVHDHKILAELVKQGNDVHLLSFQKGDLLPLPGVTLHRMPFPSSLVAFPLASLMTPALVRKIKPDIVIGNYLLTYGFYAAFANYHPLLQIAWGSDVLLAPENPL